MRKLLTGAALLAALAFAVPAQAAQTPNLVLGTMGRDVLVGTNQPDVVIAFAGNDVLAGGKGADTLRGGNGRDRLHTWAARSGVDLLIGGGGVDRCVMGPEDTARPSCEIVVVRDVDGTVIS